MSALTLNDEVIILPDGSNDGIITIDVDRLVETRMLLQANSGAGKSRTLRRILEQTYGKVQHIVFDVEGEFHTLREVYDYVLCAPRGGDCVANVQSAELLARRLLELGASAIIDLYDLGVQQARFVKLFLESMMSAPRELWHSVLVVIDEAHKFCAEKEESQSSAAVIDLMTRGRKRGFSGILATQRLSKLDKDAAAEANNLLIGRTALDLDVSRAALVLGMPLKQARATLPKLHPGEFFCVGPALSPTVANIRIGDVKTTHPKAGTRGAPPTPPRAYMQAILSKLADLPAEAEQEVRTVDQLRARVRELENDAAVAKSWQEPDSAQISALERRVLDAEYQRDQWRDRATRNEKLLTTVAQRLGDLRAEIEPASKVPAEAFLASPDPISRSIGASMLAERNAASQMTLKHEDASVPAANRLKLHGGADVSLTPGEDMPPMHRAFLIVLAQRGNKNGVTVEISKSKILIWSGYAAGGAPSRTFADLVKRGWAAGNGNGGLRITHAGLKALGAYQPLPRGRELREQIRSQLPVMERAFFDAVCDVYPEAIGKGDVLRIAGYAAGGAPSRAFAYLVAREYVRSAGKKLLIAAEEMFS